MIPDQPNRLDLVHYPDPVLRKVCSPLEEFGPRLERLIRRMNEVMIRAEGVGLAAPQMGLPIRLFICNATGEPRDFLVCANPTLSDFRGNVVGEEGCLSLPRVRVPMKRAERVVIRAFDVSGNPFEAEGHGLTARIWQHEFDHLEGRLIIDSMSETVRLENRAAIEELERKTRKGV